MWKAALACAVVGLALAGCKDAPAPEPVPEVVVVLDPDAAVPDASSPDAQKPLGEFRITYYWKAMESSEETGDDVQLFDRQCEPLATVSKSFAVRLAREGTGKLLDGRTLNVWGTCRCDHSPCYFTVGKDKPWGVGVAHRPLAPFRSVAVDTAIVPIGTMLYIPELDGLTMPGRKPWGGFVHDGCVVADDRGGRVTGQQIDLFMARKPHYQAFNRRHRLTSVTVYDGQSRCRREGTSVVGAHRNST